MSGKGKEPADSGQVEAPAMPRIQLDPGTLQLLQTLKLVLQQERTEELKDRDATKALRVVVRSLGQFEGKNVSKFLRMYKQEMDMIHVREEKMIQSFTLAVVPEMREHIQGIIDQVGVDWNQFAGRMKEEYFLHDSERVTKSSFFEWIERPQKNLFVSELLSEFDRQFLQLTQGDRAMLGVNKTDLFLRVVQPELQEKLEVRLEDKTTESGLTADWEKVKEEVLQLAKRELAKRELKNERVLVRRFVPTVPIVQEPVAAQPRPVVQKKEDTSMDELLKGMRDMILKFSQLEEKKVGGDGRPARQAWVQRCIWCDAPEHARRDCADFQETLRQGVVFWKHGKIALRDTGDFLQTNFGKGGMKKVLEDFQAAHAVATVEAASYGARASDTCEGETFEVATSSVHAYIAKSQHEALVEEKRRREEAEEETSAKRQTRLQKSRQESLPPDTVMDEVQKQAEKGKGPMKEKSKGPSYKLQSDIEASTDLKGIFEEQILNSKVEFTLRQILGIAKREFHDVIIDAIKRKRHLTGESTEVAAHVIDSVVSREEEQEIASVFQLNSGKKKKHVRFADVAEEESSVNPSHYTRDHWARATNEALVKLENVDEPVVALIDHGYEINIVSKSLYEKGRWPIDIDHNWMIRVANSTLGKLFGACPGLKVKIGDVVVEQNLFVQDATSYPVVLGQPFITAVRMETKVMDDGSAYAKIRSKDSLHSAQFLTVPANHERNKDQLRRKPLSHKVVQIHSRELYSLVEIFRAPEVLVETKYKTVAKKVKPVAASLPDDARKQTEQASRERSLRDAKKVGHKFTKATLDALKIGVDGSLLPGEKLQFREMLKNHGKAFAFKPAEIGCVDLSVVTPMIIFTVPHIPWDLRPIPVPRAHLPKLIELLKEKMGMKILEPSFAPYSSRWFTVPKKTGSLRFIQDMQPVNGVTIRNAGVGPIVDEFAEAFAGRAVYSMGDLYSGYDQFQLAEGSRDVTTMKTPLGLLRMCTLPQGATNSVAHMMNGMNKVLRDFIPEKTMPFLDDVPIKGCREEEKDEILDSRGCRRYISEHIEDYERILKRLEEVNLTLSGVKSTFGVREVVIVGHLCGWFGRKPEAAKIDAIQRIREVCKSLSEVRRFLGMCVFYYIWIPHYAHIAEPLYALSRKGQKFRWEEKHVDAMRRLKALLSSSPVLGKVDYHCGRPVILTVDTSPIAIGWAVGQDDENGNRIAVRFGARVLSSRQREYPQVKRELWGVVIAMKAERNYLIGAVVVVETDCLPLLGMITNCSTPDMTMLNWVAYIKSLNPEFKHIAGKANAVADMLSRARYEGEEEMVEESEDIGEQFYSVFEVGVNSVVGFREDLYDGEWLDIGRYLETLSKQEGWTDEEYRKVRKKAYSYMLEDGFLWKRPKRGTGVPLRVVCDRETQLKLITEFHESLWAGHRGIWATYSKLKERYWWKNMYRDVVVFVESCLTCQMYSNVRHRDGLHPTYPLAFYFKWVVDLVTMPVGLWAMRYLVLAREDLSNQVEGRALRTKATEGVCRFLLEDVICRYGCVGKVTADRGELDAKEAEEFFQRYGVKLALTTAYNPEGNAKSERGHPPIVKALVKACSGRVKQWPRLLPFALWADRTTHSSVTGYMPIELIQGQKSIMPVEELIPTWSMLPWVDNLTREELLELRIRQLEQRDEDVKLALERLKTARLKNKDTFDKKHRLRPRAIEEGDWVLVYDNSLDNQHSALRKFSRCWFGPYVVVQVLDNATYLLRELDGTPLRVPIAGKRVKIFKRRDGEDEFVEMVEDEEEAFEENEDLEDDVT
ncbi:hypothetical protein R1sor_011087 [Riccia sorocarpa]|uniref:Integrase catalytic domain-containing protein n=1 Tax=Riccia sorocarpa TaxID=122646 RepID=A0ABD3I144_9MARC